MALTLKNLVGKFQVGPGEEPIDPIRTMEDASLGHAYTYGKCGALAAPQGPPVEVYHGNGCDCGCESKG